MSQVTFQDLRRVADSLALLKGRTVVDASVRSDFRQLKLELSDGMVVVIAVESAEGGPPRLSVDVVRLPEERSRQLEVRFDTF